MGSPHGFPSTTKKGGKTTAFPFKTAGNGTAETTKTYLRNARMWSFSLFHKVIISTVETAAVSFPFGHGARFMMGGSAPFSLSPF